MFGKDKIQKPERLIGVVINQKPIFIEFTGASGSLDDDGMLKDYVPRDKITINVNRISGYYDHTILVEGRKIRVMDSYNEIALKILEAMK